MQTIISLIINSGFLKYTFGYSLTIGSLALAEQEFTNSEFFANISNSIPSKVAVVFGIIYGAAVLFSKISSAWKEHRLNIYEIKKAKEYYEQEEIKTEKQRKE